MPATLQFLVELVKHYISTAALYEAIFGKSFGLSHVCVVAELALRKRAKQALLLQKKCGCRNIRK